MATFGDKKKRPMDLKWHNLPEIMNTVQKMLHFLSAYDLVFPPVVGQYVNELQKKTLNKMNRVITSVMVLPSVSLLCTYTKKILFSLSMFIFRPHFHFYFLKAKDT